MCHFNAMSRQTTQDNHLQQQKQTKAVPAYASHFPGQTEGEKNSRKIIYIKMGGRKIPNNFLPVCASVCMPFVAIIYRLSAKIFQLNHKDSISQAIYITENPFFSRPPSFRTNEQHALATDAHKQTLALTLVIYAPKNHVVGAPEICHVQISFK